MSKPPVGTPYKRNSRNWNHIAERNVRRYREKIEEPAKPARLRIKPKRTVLNEFETAKALLGSLADERNWIRVPRRDGTVALAYILSNNVPAIVASCLDAIREMEARFYAKK